MHEHIKEFSVCLGAGSPAIWLQTYEEQRLLEMAEDLYVEKGYTVMEWSILDGGKILFGDVDAMEDEELQALASKKDALNAILAFGAVKRQGVVLLMKDMHKFIKATEVIRGIKNFIRQNNILKHLVFLSHVCQIPDDLEKDVLLARVGLPAESDLERIFTNIISENELEQEMAADFVTAVKGLTRQECVNAISLTLSEKGELSKHDLEKFKLQAIRKAGMMELFEAIDPSELGGLDKLKEYVRLRASGFENPELPTPTGMLLMGLPGGGKSLSAKVIASYLNMPLIKLDIASLKSKYVGESESKMGQALDLIDAVSPAVVWLDKLFCPG